MEYKGCAITRVTEHYTETLGYSLYYEKSDLYEVERSRFAFKVTGKYKLKQLFGSTKEAKLAINTKHRNSLKLATKMRINKKKAAREIKRLETEIRKIDDWLEGKEGK